MLIIIFHKAIPLSYMQFSGGGDVREYQIIIQYEVY